LRLRCVCVYFFNLLKTSTVHRHPINTLTLIEILQNISHAQALLG